MSQKHRVNNAFQQSMTTILLAAVLIFTAITFLSIVQLGDNGFGSIHDFVDNSHVKHQDEKVTLSKIAYIYFFIHPTYP